MKEYQKIGNHLVITIPLKKRRYNPYMETADEDGDVGEMDAIIGLYEEEYKNGLAHRIDMDYKGKDDQWSDYFYRLDGTEGEFEDMCKELGISWVKI